MKNDVLKRFGNRIRDFRMQKALSQEKLAEQSGLHRTYIGMVERGEKNVSLKNILKISKALNIKPEELFKGF